MQGVGHVGYHLVGHLVKAGAKVTVADVDAESVKRTLADFRAEAVSPDAIYDVDCDIFAPCARVLKLKKEEIWGFHERSLALAALIFTTIG